MADGLYNDQDLTLLVNAGVSPNVANDQDLVVIVQQRLVPALINLDCVQDLLLLIVQNHYKVSVTGTWQDGGGNPIANGLLTVQLNFPAVSVDNKQIDTRLSSVTLDGSGSIPAGALFLYPNALLSNDMMGKPTIYFCNVYTAEGLLVWAEERTVTTGGL